ncbi:hypothetical protein Hypma_001320 [Hypsizygus marmoreus]|uniref:Uncharacterized protein n=1 Tax=Hypsizygus marmoreus TaxID=39966 RepID=A0A369K417_HYPMA|nr:hypothetical protein Hypma_001320 [Hypsizygus marmoreus]
MPHTPSYNQNVLHREMKLQSYRLPDLARHYLKQSREERAKLQTEDERFGCENAGSSHLDAAFTKIFFIHFQRASRFELASVITQNLKAILLSSKAIEALLKTLGGDWTLRDWRMMGDVVYTKLSPGRLHYLLLKTYQPLFGIFEHIDRRNAPPIPVEIAEPAHTGEAWADLLAAEDGVDSGRPAPPAPTDVISIFMQRLHDRVELDPSLLYPLCDHAAHIFNDCTAQLTTSKYAKDVP